MNTAALVSLGVAELGAASPSAETLMRLSVKLAETINSWPGLTGPQKLTTVQIALRELLEVPAVTAKIDNANKKSLVDIIDTVLPTTITLVVSASRGEFQLQKPSVGCLAQLALALCRSAAAAAGATPAAAIVSSAAAASTTIGQPKESTLSSRRPSAVPASSQRPESAQAVPKPALEAI
jgi:hypothetical protein